MSLADSLPSFGISNQVDGSTENDDIYSDDNNETNEVDDDEVNDEVNDEVDDEVEEDDEEDDDEEEDDEEDDDEEEDDEEDDDEEEDDDNVLGVEETKGNDSSSSEEEESDESDEEEDDDYLQKFDKNVRENFLVEFHPEARAHNDEEVKMFSNVVRNKHGQIVDDLHRTLPFLTKYEYTRVIGQRSKQIESGATPFVSVASNIIDGDVIAHMELEEKKLPFIIRRPMPGGGFEYWKLEDLEVLR